MRPMSDDTVNVRYMVDDVDAAIDFYTNHLGFELISSAAPAFADVRRGALRLLLFFHGRIVREKGRPDCSSRPVQSSVFSRRSAI